MYRKLYLLFLNICSEVNILVGDYLQGVTLLVSQKVVTFVCCFTRICHSVKLYCLQCKI